VALAGVDDGHLAAGEAEAALGELRRLAESTGAVVLGETLVRLRRIDPATYFSSGKVEELRALLETLGADGLVVDTETQPNPPAESGRGARGKGH
jgi:GTP-binding protein HflX